MNFNQVISALFRPIRSLIIMAACALIIFANVSPAFAIGSNRTNPTEGSVQLDEIQRKSEEVTKEPPLGLRETASEANKGINEIQGDSDADKMYRPETSRQATSVEEQVKDALENLTGKK